jgi:hypothetical protein
MTDTERATKLEAVRVYERPEMVQRIHELDLQDAWAALSYMAGYSPEAFNYAMRAMKAEHGA